MSLFSITDVLVSATTPQRSVPISRKHRSVTAATSAVVALIVDAMQLDLMYILVLVFSSIDALLLDATDADIDVIITVSAPSKYHSHRDHSELRWQTQFSMLL